MDKITDIQFKILREIRRERDYQDAKWGAQTHSPNMWQIILQEEIDEARTAPNDVAMLSELIQAAAVIVAWCEMVTQQLALSPDEIQSRNWDEGKPVIPGQPITFTIDTEPFQADTSSVSVGQMLEKAECNPAKNYYLQEVINGQVQEEKHFPHHMLRPNGRVFISVYTGPATNQ